MSEINYPAKTRSAEPDKTTPKGHGNNAPMKPVPAGGGDKKPDKIVRDGGQR